MWNIFLNLLNTHSFFQPIFLTNFWNFSKFYYYFPKCLSSFEILCKGLTKPLKLFPFFFHKCHSIIFYVWVNSSVLYSNSLTVSSTVYSIFSSLNIYPLIEFLYLVFWNCIFKSTCVYYMPFNCWINWVIWHMNFPHSGLKWYHKDSVIQNDLLFSVFPITRS